MWLSCCLWYLCSVSEAGIITLILIGAKVHGLTSESYDTCTQYQYDLHYVKHSNQPLSLFLYLHRQSPVMVKVTKIIMIRKITIPAKAPVDRPPPPPPLPSRTNINYYVFIMSHSSLLYKTILTWFSTKTDKVTVFFTRFYIDRTSLH